jgi:uncharacterized protein
MPKHRLALLSSCFLLACSACVVRFDVRTTVAVVTAFPTLGVPPLFPTDTGVPTSTTVPLNPPTPVHTSLPTPTPDPFSPYFVDSLRARAYPGGPIEIVQTLEQNAAYTGYAIAYPSDGLRITGLMNVPNGDGPFPVLILNHGYYDPAVYVPGNGTRNAADVFARSGYLTLASDYRGYAGSDPGENYFRTGYVVDVLNLIASVGSLPQANAESIGVWGHSMGGGVSVEVSVVNPPGVRGVLLYAAMSGDMAANYYRIAWFRGLATPGPEWPLPPESAPESYRLLSPIHHLQYVSVPIQIHHGYFDDQVPYDWSLRLNTALTQAGKDVVFHTYPTANHSFFDADWTLFMQRGVEFFDRLLK